MENFEKKKRKIQRLFETNIVEIFVYYDSRMSKILLNLLSKNGTCCWYDVDGIDIGGIVGAVVAVTPPPRRLRHVDAVSVID